MRFKVEANVANDSTLDNDVQCSTVLSQGKDVRVATGEGKGRCTRKKESGSSGSGVGIAGRGRVRRGESKKKLVEADPFQSPSQEKARRNADKARIRREMLKAENEKLLTEVKMLAEENVRLGASLKILTAKAVETENVLQAIKDLFQSNKLTGILNRALRDDPACRPDGIVASQHMD